MAIPLLRACSRALRCRPVSLRQSSFFLRFLTLGALVHLYVGARLIPDGLHHGPSAAAAVLALALSCILIPLGMLARSSARPPWGDRIAWVGLADHDGPVLVVVRLHRAARRAAADPVAGQPGGPGIGLDRAAAGLGLVGGDTGAGGHHRGLRQRAGSRAWSRWTCPSPACRPTWTASPSCRSATSTSAPPSSSATCRPSWTRSTRNRRTSSPSPATWSTAASNSWPRRPARWASCARLMACIW